ncbi:MAG: hypothetical protein HY812_07815 [Planctomycetes bacterium]|nr:hypothetical protein [Planctomycetota bacterium]
MRIGIRREDKSRFEGRVPLVPAEVERLVKNDGIEFTVQRSPIRALGEDLFVKAGARIGDDLADCGVILGVKEIPPAKLEPGKTYAYFSHVIKGQPANMPALARIIELGATLIDFEKITDEQGQRLVAFGRFAGLAGMIDSLWALGRRLLHEGQRDQPFADCLPAPRYRDLEHARRTLSDVADRIRLKGLPENLRPFVCGFTGYGKVSTGAQEIFDLLPVKEVAPAELPGLPRSANECFKVVFREGHMVERIDASRPFNLREYYDLPDLYRGAFFPHAHHLTVLMNCIYWESKYPRLLAREQLAELYRDPAAPPRLKVIGDISCDIDGSVACTVRPTAPDNPVYVYDPATGQAADGVAGIGPVVLAIDFLPSELPVDASKHFSRALAPLVAGLAHADLEAPFEKCGLPPELARATIVYRGELTERYRYLKQYLPS